MRKKNKSQIPKEDLFVRLTLLQTAAAIVIGAIFFGAYKYNAGLFTQLSEGLHELLAQDMDINDYIPYHFMRETTGPAAESTQETTEGQTESETVLDGAGGADEAVSDGSVSVNADSAAGIDGAVMPVNGNYTSFFGGRIHPIYGTEGFHSGVDIAAPEGTPILAALDGTVVDCGVGEMSGNYVKLDNGDATQTLYCHCSGLNVGRGQTVKRGDVIAFVGQTGLATGPHLHFELHINGVKCDPLPLLENAVRVS